jgi:hypothetical protein
MGTWPRRLARPLLGGGPRAIDAPPRRVSARAQRSHPSASRSVSQTRAWHDHHHLAVGVRFIDSGGGNSVATGACWLSTRKGVLWVVG